MDVEDIKNRDKLALWLTERTGAEAARIAQRAALRTLPSWLVGLEIGRARTHVRSAMPVIRAILVCTAASDAERPDSVILAAANAAARASSMAADAADNNAFAASAAAAFAAASLMSGVDARPAADAADASAVLYPDAAWIEIQNDVRHATSGAANETPIWGAEPQRFVEAVAHMRTVWAPSTPGGDFWMRWYQGFLDGNPLPWDLLRDIALIADEDWQKGEAHIARLIEIIEERHRLLALVAGLKKSLAEATAASTGVATPEHRSHNQPPELIDAPAQLRAAVTVIRIALDEAETELARPDPVPSTLRWIAEKLTDAVKAAALWCGDKLDVFFTEAAKEAGKAFGGWGVKALIASMAVAAAAGPMQSLIKGLTDLASRLSP